MSISENTLNSGLNLKGKGPKLLRDNNNSKDNIKVDFYYKDRSKLKTYLIQVKLAFKLRPSKYEEELDQVIFTTL